MLNKNYNKLYFFLISLAIFISDQFSKYIINLNYKSLINKDLFFFSLDYVKNFGAAFNIFSGSRIFLSLVSIIITIILSFIIFNKNNISNIEFLSYSFILGGTIGNGIDRITKGYVIDFIKINFVQFPIFNLADIFINIGFILFVYSFIKNKR